MIKASLDLGYTYSSSRALEICFHPRIASIKIPSDAEKIKISSKEYADIHFRTSQYGDFTPNVTIPARSSTMRRRNKIRPPPSPLPSPPWLVLLGFATISHSFSCVYSLRGYSSPSPGDKKNSLPFFIPWARNRAIFSARRRHRHRHHRRRRGKPRLGFLLFADVL